MFRRFTVFLTLIIFALLTGAAIAQTRLPVIKSNSRTISIQDGEILKKNGWNLVPTASPDIYEADLIDGKAHEVTFITDIDRISFKVEESKKYDFIIDWNGQLCHTQIVGTRFIPAARFDKKYQAEYKRKTTVEIPEVYELVNIAIAMTSTGMTDKYLVYKDSDYYKNMRQWFDKYQDHPLLAALDKDLRSNPMNYTYLKMDGYAFEFDKNGRIVQSEVYDRLTGRKSNILRPYIAQLQSFADATSFRKFYKRNKVNYRKQIDFYQNEANVSEMKKWLVKNFPTSNDYDVYKIIFSPLVYGSQSGIRLENNGFREFQTHVNFPYSEDLKRNPETNNLSKKAAAIARGDIVFTEINHGYINPESDKYATRIAKATSNRDFWVDKSYGANYYGGINAFNEYLNWALICLRYVDYVPRAEQDKMIALTERTMTNGRGFPQFAAFDKFLVDLYRNRRSNQTIVDLYPQIIEWFEKNNQLLSEKK